MLVCVERTTLILEDACIEGVRLLAHREHRNMSSVVNELLADGLQRRNKARRVPFRIPVFPMGKPTINIGDRDALEAAMGD